MPLSRADEPTPYALQALMEEDEVVLWWDRPDPVGLMLGTSPWLLAAALFLAGAASLMVFEWGIHERHPGFLAFALLLFAVLNGGILGGMARRYRAARSTLYALTNRRVVVRSPLLPGGGGWDALPAAATWQVERAWRGLAHAVFGGALGGVAFGRLCNLLPLWGMEPGFYFLADLEPLYHAYERLFPHRGNDTSDVSSEQ